VRIAYECSTIRANRSGIGRVAEQLARALAAEIGPGDELWMLTNGAPPGGMRAAAPGWPRWPTSLWLQVAVPRIARRGRFDLFHFTNSMAPVFAGAPYVVTIHDLSLVRHPETHPLRRRVVQRTLLGRTARRARRVIAVSEATACDVVDLLGVPRERVAVTPLAVADGFRPVVDAERLAAVRARYGLEGPVLLYVGNVEPRKNLVRLVDAFERLGAADTTLAIAGGLAWMSGEVERRVAGYRGPGRVRLLGYVADEDLAALYSTATAAAYVSIWEGFGLPVLEAMACGTPVVCSRIPAIEEVAGGAARLVDPYSVAEIADGLAAVLSNGAERERLSAAGLARAAEFSWQDTARRTLAVYRDALASLTAPVRPRP
jgi:glycosyltransferase involved in cell wall biosynthesis